MLDWFVSNIANISIGAVVLIIIAFAGSNVYKTRQRGGCSGCPSSSSCGGGCSGSSHKVG